MTLKTKPQKTLRSYPVGPPLSITKLLHRSVERCLSKSPSSKDIFYKTAPYFEQRFANSGCNENLTYQQEK